MDEREIEDIDAGLRAAFAEPLPDSTTVDRAVRRRIRTGRVLLWLPLAAAAILVAGIVRFEFASYSHRHRIYGELTRDHQREVVEHAPRRWKSAPDELDLVTAQYRLTRGLAASMAPRGFHLEHAKTCGLGGKPVLHLVFTNGSEEVSIYVRPRGSGDFSGSGEINSEHITAFRTARFEAAVVTTAERERCNDFAKRASAVL